MKALEDIVALDRLPKLLSWVDYRGPNGCWNWTRGKKEGGYGTFVALPNKDARSVHAIFYEIRHGAVPDELYVDHTCRNPSCVNPAHLEAVTCGENVLRGEGPTALNARKTHCGGCGNEFDGTRKLAKGRVGRTCSRYLAEASRRYRARQKGCK